MPRSHIEHYLVAADDLEATRDWYQLFLFDPNGIKIIVHGEIVFDGGTVAELEQNPLVKHYYQGAP